MNDNYIVMQDNKLVEARHNNPLTAREQKIILTMASMIQPSDEDFKDYRISVKEFTEMLGLKCVDLDRLGLVDNWLPILKNSHQDILKDIII